MSKDHWDAILASAPLNATAGAVTSRSHGLAPAGAKVNGAEWDSPPPYVRFNASGSGAPDLTGRRFGRLTVTGYIGDGKWCCRCACGTYVSRRAKAVLNPANAEIDRCSACRHTAFLQRETSAEKTLYRRQNGIVRLPGQ